MSQLPALVHKNMLLIKKAKYEVLFVFGFCFSLPMLCFFIPYGSLIDRTDQGTSKDYELKYDSHISLFASPNTIDVMRIVETAVATLKNTVRTNFQIFKDPVLMTEELKKRTRSSNSYSPYSSTYVGVEFVNATGPEFLYYIRPVLSFSSPPTLHLFHGVQQCVSKDCSNAYVEDSPLLVVQHAIDQALIEVSMNSSLENKIQKMKIQFKCFPKPSEKVVRPNTEMIFVLPVSIANVPLLRFVVDKLMEEKECSMKQLLVVMGMRLNSFFLSWFLVFFAAFFLLSICLTLIIGSGFYFSQSVSFFFLATIFHGMCIFSVGFFISSLFKKARKANIFATFISLLTTLVYILVPLVRAAHDPFYFGNYYLVIYALMLFPTFTYTMALDLMFFAQIFRDGVVGETYYTFGHVTAITILFWLLLLFCMYTALGFFFERLLSSEYGDRPSWLAYFDSATSGACASEIGIKYPEKDFERPNSEWQPMIRISKVKKEFKQMGKDAVLAVRGITLDIFDSQITCILGHNGAGKSTLIGMMTRLLRPTSGTITFCDQAVQQTGSIGICPQGSSYYKSLTVREHLNIVCRLKNLQDSKNAMDQVMEEVGLYDCADKKCSTLSGGQQRRLNVAIALIGDPKVIFLDEPTTGVDPLSRRAIWQILQSRKADHCIILTTHYMDEADILADRKAIVSQGTLRCVGSSLFLKNRFGAGYHLNAELISELDDNKLESCKQKLLQFIDSNISDAEIREETRTLLSVTLPFVHIHKFPQLFKALESPADKASNCTLAQSFGLRTYGIELTTLEEVFLKLTNEALNYSTSRAVLAPAKHHSQHHHHAAPARRAELTIGPSKILQNANDASQLFELRALLEDSVDVSSFKKWITLLLIRWHMTINAWFGTIAMLLLPPVLICLFVYSTAGGRVQIEESVKYPPLRFDPLIYAAPAEGDSSLPPFILDFDEAHGKNRIIFRDAMPSMQVLFAPIDQGSFDYNMGLAWHSRSKISIWFRDKALHSAPIALNVFSNWVLRSITGTNTMSINTICAPVSGFSKNSAHLEMDEKRGMDKEKNEEKDKEPAVTTTPTKVEVFIVILPVAISIIFTVSAIRLHAEFNSGSFNQLRCTGISGSVYWFAQFTLDAAMYILLMFFSYLAIIIGMKMVNVHAIDSLHVIRCYILALVVYAPISILFLYIVVLTMRNSSAAFISLTIFLLYLALPFFLYGYIMFERGRPESDEKLPSIFYLSLCVPTFLFHSIGVAAYHVVLLNPDPNLTFYQFLHAENELIDAFLSAALYIIILTYLLLLLHKCVAEKHSSINNYLNSYEPNLSGADLIPTEIINSRRDSDVLAEETEIRNLLIQRKAEKDTVSLPALVCHDLSLYYNTFSVKKCCIRKTAVKSLNMSIPNSQIFGLLGPNGAGKTSTLKVISGGEHPAVGSIFIGGIPIATMSLAQLFDKVSVCTQDDGLWMMLTVRNHLDYYARLRGYQGETRKQLVDTLIDLLKIKAHANKRCEQLSGGTKRKVVFAISMMKTSRMRLILCDEPTSGLDPQSKRVLWNVLTGLFRGGSQSDCACIFTSHSMEEVEAVCDRIGIMINGQLHCLGTIQHCKNKFGNAYCVELKLKNADNVDGLWKFLQSNFPRAESIETFVNTSVRVNIPRSDVKSLAFAFEVLEKARQDSSFNIEEYSFGQSTLEQVFLDLVKKHVGEVSD